MVQDAVEMAMLHDSANRHAFLITNSQPDHDSDNDDDDDDEDCDDD